MEPAAVSHRNLIRADQSDTGKTSLGMATWNDNMPMNRLRFKLYDIQVRKPRLAEPLGYIPRTEAEANYHWHTAAVPVST
ncbi:hypothetical protein [Azonexus sp.]|uniref:hypothetical protein n=1 Tax=Azonexus sp. TaxID=1872668 RepID=UPI00283AB1E7|nr:hypothetical protein [Azonexus sp.]